MTPQALSLVTPTHVALDLDLPLHRIVGIGPRQAQRLEKLGLSTVRDLLFHLPRRYEDTRETVPLRALQPGGVQTARVRIRNISARRSPYKKMVLVEATLEDDGAVASAVWFNQPFLTRQLQPGMELMVSGKVEQSR
ncbi:MAG: ATP-dependent helicase RecG, partial [Chloroflexota bacterium]|nr:ATP-dependent helicase RecG [Chloroflexota bacterium]